MKKKTIFYLLGTTCFLSIGVAGTWYFDQIDLPKSSSLVVESGEEEENPEETASMIKLSAEQLQNAGFELRIAGPGKLHQVIHLPGKVIVNPELYAHVVTKAGGIVKEARKNSGDKIQSGEILAVLESKEMAETKGAYLAALKQEQLSQIIYEREKRLKERQISALSEFLEAEANAGKAKIDLELAKQRLYALGLSEEDIGLLPGESPANFRLLEIRAPFDGVVLARHLTNGEVVDGSQETYVVADLSQVWIEMGIYPKDIVGINEGQKIRIVDDSNGETEAAIIRLSPIIDPETSRVKAIALLNNQSGKWRPGTYVNGNLEKSEEPASILVSKDAVINIDNENYLFVSHPDGFEKRGVVKGREDGKNVEILSGIRPGERYVAKNAFLLKFELVKGEPE